MLEEQRPVGATPEEIEGLLAAVPDLRQALAAATPEELATILETFADTTRPPGGGRRKSGIAGAVYGQTSATAYRFTETLSLG